MSGDGRGWGLKIPLLTSRFRALGAMSPCTLARHCDSVVAGSSGGRDRTGPKLGWTDRGHAPSAVGRFWARNYKYLGLRQGMYRNGGIRCWRCAKTTVASQSINHAQPCSISPAGGGSKAAQITSRYFDLGG